MAFAMRCGRDGSPAGDFSTAVVVRGDIPTVQYNSLRTLSTRFFVDDPGVPR
jgi:hypothetical protein